MVIFGLALVALVLLAKGGRLRDRMLQLALGPSAGCDGRARQSHGRIVHHRTGNFPPLARAHACLYFVAGRLGLRSVDVLRGRARLWRQHRSGHGRSGNDAHHRHCQSRDAGSVVARLCRTLRGGSHPGAEWRARTLSRAGALLRCAGACHALAASDDLGRHRMESFASFAASRSKQPNIAPEPESRRPSSRHLRWRPARLPARRWIRSHR